MILTNCAACAAPLERLAKQCSRCKTRYCNEACQRQHWERGGHEAVCRRIKRGGGAEQYYADKKYKEAVAVAVEACAEDTTARGLPPDWTEVELERQGYDLWATRPEDVHTGPPPVPDPWRGDGRGVAAAMRAQLESAFSESG